MGIEKYDDQCVTPREVRNHFISLIDLVLVTRRAAKYPRLFFLLPGWLFDMLNEFISQKQVIASICSHSVVLFVGLAEARFNVALVNSLAAGHEGLSVRLMMKSWQTYTPDH